MSTPKQNMEILPRGVQVTLGLGLIALCAFPFTSTDYYTEMIMRMMIMAIFAMSLDLLQGVTGLVSLRHAAYFGLAGYALAYVSVDLWRGRIQAVIGPNGAGKSTLTNLLSGDLPLTSGSVQLGDKDVTGWRPEKISAQGLGRSYQKTNIFLPFMVWENVRLAAQSRALPAASWFSRATKYRAINDRAESVIALSGLNNRKNSIAGTISHGEQRQLEIAMTLATGPQVLLLDEPLAGMGAVEAERMVSLLQSLKKDHGILLVEHGMDAVFTLADQLTVMVTGQVIASGTPAEIRLDAGVQAAYLGEDIGEESV